MPEDLSYRITGDGSRTLYAPRFGQHYHSTNGAVSESRHVFLEQNGLKDALKTRDEIDILEVGFGTGLNLLLLMDEFLSSGSSAKIRYHSVEAFPVSTKLAGALNYGEHLQYGELARKLFPLFDRLEPDINTFKLTSLVQLTIFYGLFKNYEPDDLRADFIFHDAFSPQANPELWTGKVFKKLLQCSDSEALLTTYCAASRARGAMAWAGWKVARAEGAPGKREMTVASPTKWMLSHLERVNEERLARRYEEGDF